MCIRDRMSIIGAIPSLVSSNQEPIERPTDWPDSLLNRWNSSSTSGDTGTVTRIAFGVWGVFMCSILHHAASLRKLYVSRQVKQPCLSWRGRGYSDPPTVAATLSSSPPAPSSPSGCTTPIPQIHANKSRFCSRSIQSSTRGITASALRSS